MSVITTRSNRLMPKLDSRTECVDVISSENLNTFRFLPWPQTLLRQPSPEYLLPLNLSLVAYSGRNLNCLYSKFLV